ncbi:MAG: zinc ribbon domain-containing protein [Gemmatimonadales bacterium]|nr:zinc ribbon domain-containing protein [Gemmatimonadales bacterium]
MTKTSTPCPACGAPQTGKFCSRCGANLESGSCGGCGAKLPGGVKFCPACGAPTSDVAAAGGRSDRTPWIVASVAIVALLAVVLVMVIRSSPGRPPAAATASPAGAGPDTIDLAAMTPRERFDRLYNRVMRAAEGGDPSTVTNFAPMALQSYDMLPEADRDPDARYHAAMLHLHSGAAAEAVAHADTIQAEIPTHLFGFVIRGTAAKLENDAAALSRAYADYMEHYGAEMNTGRQEYGEHPAILESFRQEALGAGG